MKEIVISWFLTPIVAGIVSFVLYKIFFCPENPLSEMTRNTAKELHPTWRS
ncbi:MAG: hypothetical protein HY912_22245 [Desulfomonile tiedjei]|uniref:Uncharacterized protein n=1 Tax=Desulfomonile tiedjei TaxID=2358 RepID=A0A9D6Z5K9_9BACT|nr:hypothetical protein [Desulfomonile tiedjei]